MFKRKKTIIGIDYGYSHLHGVEVSYAGDAPRLVKWGYHRMPAGAVDLEGRVLDPSLLAQGLKGLVQEAKFSSKRVVTMVPSGGLVVRTIVMPDMAPSELKEAAKWEAAQYLPYPMEEAECDFVPIIRNEPEQAQEREVLLISARTPEVDLLVQAFQKAGLELSGIDAGPLALARASGVGLADREACPARQIMDDPLGEAAAAGYEFQSDSISEALLDLGSGTTDVSIFRDGYLKVTRCITIGTSKFDEKIAQHLGVEIDEAYQIMISEAHINADGIVPIGEDRQTQISQAVQEVAEEMLEEIQRSLDYYRAQNGWIPIDRIIASGTGVRIPGMIEYLSNNLGMTVEVVNPLVRLEQTVEIPPDIESYTMAIGLALWEVGS